MTKLQWFGPVFISSRNLEHALHGITFIMEHIGAANGLHPQHKLIVNDSGINEYDIMRWIITCAYYCDIPNLLIIYHIIKDEALWTNCNVSHVTSVTLHQCLLLQTWETYKSNIIKDEALCTNCNVSHVTSVTHNYVIIILMRWCSKLIIGCRIVVSCYHVT